MGRDAVLVFIISALWHGFYPVYYVIGVIMALGTEVSKDIYRARSLFSFLPVWVSYILCQILSHLHINFIVTMFLLMKFERCHNFLKATNYYMIIAVVGLLLISKLGGIVKFAKRRENEIMDAKEMKKA